MDVLVRDRAAFPRDKPCAGWVTPGTLETLGLDPAEYARAHTLQTFTGFRTGLIGGPDLVTRYGRPAGYAVRRCEFDQFLLERSGARARCGFPVASLERARDAWVVDGATRTPLLVGAAGHFCPVARLLNGAQRPAAVVVAQEVEFRMDARGRAACRVEPEIPELFFCRDLQGYGWCVRKNDYLNVGLGRRDAAGLSARVQAFLAFLAARGSLPRAIPSRLFGHAYLLYEGPPRRVVDDGVVLVGDAAGLAAPESGEGIRPAVESGILAAAAILAARGRYGREQLSPYAAALQARLGPRRTGLRLPQGLTAAVGRPLLSSPWFARRVVLDRWFLQVERSPLRVPLAAAC
jgi:flavin-dependent dehydrogenase